MVLKEYRQSIEKQGYWSQGTLLLLSCLFLILTSTAFSQTHVNREPDAKQLELFNYLYENKEYHRSITEILRLKFRYSQTSEKAKLDLYLLKNYYQLKEHTSVISVASEILTEMKPSPEKQTGRQPSLILVSSLLHQGYEKRAQHIWEDKIRDEETVVFASSVTVANRIDSNLASFYSGILPGSGFLLSDEYGKAAVSFALNLIFISASYHAFKQQQFGVAGLLMFFEVNWYFGGKKASAEAARQLNYKNVRRYQQNWIHQQLRKNDLSDLIHVVDE